MKLQEVLQLNQYLPLLAITKEKQWLRFKFLYNDNSFTNFQQTKTCKVNNTEIKVSS